MKKKTKSKSGTQSDEQSNSLKLDQPDSKAKSKKSILSVVLHHKRYWLLPILIVLIAYLGWYLSQTWLVRTTFSQAVTYPKVSVLGTNVGDLSASKLNDKLTELKTKFEAKKVTLVNGKSQWVFDANKLGATVDVKATSQAILHLNKLSIVDKYRLMTGKISSVIEPILLVDNDTCVKALSVIPSVQIESKDASVYFDQTAKIQPDQPGSKFNAVLTCQELPRLIKTESFTTNVALDIIPANLTKADLESKLPQIQSMVGKPLSLKSGTYQLTQTPEQLLALLDISKQGSDVHVDWSSGKLDTLVSGIASKVNTYNSSPALGSCQKLVSVGGNWLDQSATKKIFTNLGTNSSRSYNLSVVSHESSVSTISPVAAGSKGVIYLTFDDGMTYGNQIMNYAACYGVKITFFEIGERAAGTDAAALRRAIAEGHSVQSHGHYHAMYDYGARSYDWQYNDLNQSITDIMDIAGVRPTYFRPPGGNRSSTTYDAAGANGLKVILWGVSSADATVGGISSATTCANVLAGAYPGASVLMHSTKQSTANAVPCIIEGLAARGYSMQALR